MKKTKSRDRGGGGRLSNSGKRDLVVKRVADVFDIAPQAAFDLLSIPRRQSLRLNPLAGDIAAIAEEVVAPNREFLEPLPWCEHAYHMHFPPEAGIAQDAFARGLCYIQNAASFLPALALEPQPGDRILDLCAAPGGKSSHIAALTGNRARLWLNDGIASRLPKLREVVDLLQVETESVTAHPGQMIERHLDGPFDRILIDAQCTGEGMMNASIPGSFRYWALDRVEQYSMLQRKMLMAAHKLLKPGGTLVYSTCTFSPEENEVPVAHLLKHRADMRLEPIAIDAPGLVPARTAWEGQRFGEEMRHARRVRPSPHMEGFFVAKLVKAGAG